MKAINLKGLFSKLSNYGDDALRMVSNYGDDALDYGLDINKYVNNIPEEMLEIPQFTNPTVNFTPYDAHVTARQDWFDRNRETAHTLLGNSGRMALNPSEQTIDLLDSLNNKYYTELTDIINPEDGMVEGFGLARAPYTNYYWGYDYGLSPIAHAGNRKLKAYYDLNNLDRFGYPKFDDSDLPF